MTPLADRRRLGRLLRRLGLSIAAASGVAALWPLVGSAGASGGVTVEVPVAASAWFWNQQVSGVGAPGAPPVELKDPTVPSGDLAVAGPNENGQPEKETYLSFGLDAIPAGAQILSFTVTLPVDSAGTNLVPSGIAAPVIACLPSGSWAAGGPQPFSEKPTDQCTDTSPKVTTKDSGKTYKVDVASLAQRWLGSSGLNVGVAITDDPSNTSTPYQVVFGPATALQKLTATVTYTPAVATAAPSPPSASGPNAAPPATTGSQGVPAVTPTASSGPVATVPSASSAAASPPATAPVPSSPNQAREPAPANVRRNGTGTFLPAGFWITGLVLAFMLVISGVVLSSPTEDPSRRRTGGLGRLLASRNVHLGKPSTGRVST